MEQDVEKLISESAGMIAVLAEQKLDETLTARLEAWNSQIEQGVEEAQKLYREEAAKEQRKIIEIRNGETRELEGTTLPDCFDDLLGLAMIRQNILMVGPSGSGKTFLAGKLAEALGFQFAAQSCSAGMSESQLTGWLLPVKDGGTFQYVPSPFVNLYENGGVYLLDEIDASDPNTLVFINTALAGDSFYLPQRFDNPEIKKHKDFVCVAAANTLGLGASEMYTGRERLDAATLDRFRAGVVKVDYSDKVEEALVHEEILDIGREIRKVIKQNDLERIVSTRVLLDITRQRKELMWSLAKVWSFYFRDWTDEEVRYIPDDLRVQIKRNKIQEPSHVRV